MGWTEAQKQQSKEKILQSASELFIRDGYDRVGINDVMKHAGMTRGAFYNHFSSKSDLYAEAILTAARSAQSRMQAEQTKKDVTYQKLVEQYLSLKHRNGNEVRCPLAFLTTDITQRDDKVRDIYTRALKGFIDNLKVLKPGEEASEDEAMQQAIMMIGAVAISRAVDDESYAEKLLNSCRSGILS